MLDRENANTHPLNVKSGDFVYICREPMGRGQQLRSHWTEPLVMEKFSYDSFKRPWHGKIPTKPGAYE